MLEDTPISLLNKLASKKLSIDQTSLVLFEESYLLPHFCNDIISECPEGSFLFQFYVTLKNITVVVHDYA